MKKKMLLVLILLLTIGFAALATTLYINGSTKISVNEDECKNSLMFTKALVDNVNLSSTIISNDGKTITFETKELKSVGDKSTLKYTITNNSNQYGNQASLSLNISSNEYIKVTNNRTDYGLNSGESVDGTLTVELIKGCMKSTEGTCDITFSAEIVGVCTETGAGVEPIVTQPLAKYKLTVDPNGGVYNNTTDISEIEYERESEITLEDPTRENYIFMGWESDSLNYNNGVVIMNSDVTVRAKWVASDSVVARIVETGEIYSTLQAAFDAVQTNQTIELLQDITEISSNTKTCTLDMNHFTINGSINNTGNLTVINGTIDSTNTNGSATGTKNDLSVFNNNNLLNPFNKEPMTIDLTDNETIPAIVNSGTLTLGVDDGVINSKYCDPTKDDGCVIVVGHVGIRQNGKLDFYDGYISADVGIVGGCDKTPKYRLTEDGSMINYKPFVDKGDMFLQLVYLTNPDKAVSKTIEGGEVYFYNLQDNINASELTGLDIYLIRNFDATYNLTVHEGKKINIDLAGYNVNTGYSITNNGELNITDTVGNGSINESITLTNNGILNINNINITTTTDVDAVTNNNKITTSKTNITGGKGYGIRNNGELDISNDSLISATSNYGLLNEKDNLLLTKGTFKGIKNTKTMTIKNANVSNYDEWSVYNTGVLTVDNVTINSTRKGIYSKNMLTINDCEINSYGDSVGIYDSNNTSIINGGTYNSETDTGIYVHESSATIKDGEFNCKYGAYPYYGSMTVNGGSFNGTHSALKTYNSTLIVNDGEIHGVNTGDSYGIIVDWWSKVTVNDGNITGNTDGIYVIHSDTMYIKGGKIIGNNRYGIYTNGGIVFGDNDGEVSTESPYIKGELYGFYNDGSSTVYDGVFIGKTSGYNNFNTILDGYHIGEEVDGEYTKNYLVAEKNFCKVGDTEFNSLQKAIDSIESTGTIVMIDDITVNSKATIPSGKNITFDLNSHEYKTYLGISNDGTLVVDDTSNEKKGKIINLGKGREDHTIKTNGNFTLNNGEIRCSSSDYSAALYSRSGSIYIIGGKVYGEYEGIETSGKTIIDDGYIYGKTYAIQTLYNWGTDKSHTINGGTFESPNTCIKTGDGTNIVNGGTFEGSHILDNAGNTYIRGGTMHATSTGLIINNENVYFSGGTLTSDEIAVYANWYGYFEISGGNITGETYGVYCNDMRHMGIITGGNIEGKTKDGLYVYWTNDYIQIGLNDSEVSNENPIIKGAEYGIRSNSGARINFYDGIFIGNTNGHIVDNFKSLADGYVIFEDEKDNLKRTYLKPKENICKVGDVGYNSLQKAIDSIESTGTVELITSSENQTDISIPSGKNVTIDLHGYTFTNTKSITNNGNLTIIDNTEEKNGTINANTNDQGFVVIRNNSNLTIESGNIRLDYDYNTTVIESKYGSNTIMNGGIITGARYGVDISGSATFNGGTINSGFDALTIGNQDVTINNLTINSNSTAIHKSSDGKLIIKDCDVTGKTGLVYDSDYGSVEIQGGKIHGTNVGVDTNADNMLIAGGTITGDSIGIYVGRYGSFKMTGGDVTGGNHGVYATPTWRKTIEITNGTVTGNNGYGIYTSNPLNIGTNDDIILEKPVITGTTYGVYIDEATNVYYYDGIIKGVSGIVNADFKAIAPNSQINVTTDNDIMTAKLVTEENVIKNNTQGISYVNISDALTNANANDEFELLKDVYLYYQVIFDKSITLDLKGYDIDTTYSIINNADNNITIKNTSSDESIIKTTFALNIITNKGILTLDNITFNNSSTENYLIDNSGTLYLNDVNMNSYKCLYSEGIIDLDNTNITARNIGIKTLGSYTIKDSNIKGKEYVIYSNTENDSSITNTKLNEGNTELRETYSLYNNNSGKVDSDESNYYGDVYNNGTLNNTKDTITRKMINNNILKLDQSNINIYDNEIFRSNNYNLSVINNSGTLELRDSNINVDMYQNYTYGYQRMITNTGTANFYNANIKYDNHDHYNIGTNYGIYNTGILNIHSLDIDMNEAGNIYGIYNTGENALVSIDDASIKVDGVNAKGIYMETGTVVLGEYDGIGTELADVKDTPYIEAIGTTSGIAFTKNNGLFKYYDGKLVGSTTSIGETPTETEYHYEAISTTDNTTGYSVCTLVYIR